MFFRKKKEIKPEIYTEETCQSCSEKYRRNFVDGDYVYRRGNQCKKCSSADTLVSAIYGEYPQDTGRA
ncbi:MAG: hypothetical protein MN733_14095 [Nitrososphaera sp.]|nr:hypothetical protein [Nitrososphaera sp.]